MCCPLAAAAATAGEFERIQKIVPGFLSQFILFCIVFVRIGVVELFPAASLSLCMFFFILPHSQKLSEWSSDDETKELNTVAPVPTQANHVQTEGSAPGPSYRKSLRLSSDQIVR